MQPYYKVYCYVLIPVCCNCSKYRKRAARAERSRPAYILFCKDDNWKSGITKIN